MKIYIAAKDDIDILMALRLEMLRVVNGLPEDHAFSDELISCSRRYFLSGDQVTSIAVDNKKAIACASISYYELMPTFSHPTGKRAHIMNVYTNESYRRQGIARKLVKLLIDDADKKGTSEISLDTTDLGRPFYESLGFIASEECMIMTLHRGIEDDHRA